MVHRQPLHGPAGDGAAGGGRLLRLPQHAAGGPPRPLRCAGHHQDRVPRTGAAGGGGPGHLSADHRHAVGAQGQGGAGLFLLRRQLRLRHLRGRHRHVLGPLPGAGVPQRGGGGAPGGGPAHPGAGRHRGGLDLPVRPGGPHRPPRPGRAALHPGLVPQVRAADRQGGGRQPGRHGPPVPGGGGPGEAARLRHPPGQGEDGPQARQPGDRRLGGGDGRGGVHGARQRLRELAGRPARDPGGAKLRHRHPGPRPRRGGGAPGSGAAPRRRRA